MNRPLFLLLLSWTGAGGFAGSAFAETSVRIYSPTNGTVYLQPTNVPLTVEILVAVSSDNNAPTDIYDGTNLLGSTSLQQHHVLTWKNIDLGEHALVAIHRASTGPITSSVVRLLVAYGGYAIIPPGSVWHYRDGGVNLGATWRGTNVDLSAWPQGPAKLGFGDDDVATWLDWQNPINGEVYPTYYFRHAFTVPNPLGHSNAAVRLRRDDGAIVYLNGEELFRDNMPEGEVDYLTPASAVVDDEYQFIQRWVNPARLLPGTNHLAVEIHNAHPHNEDVGFDLGLIVNIPVPPPRLAIQRLASSVLVSWPVDYKGYALQSITTLASGGTAWMPLTSTLSSTQDRLVHSNQLDGVVRFFRLVLE